MTQIDGVTIVRIPGFDPPEFEKDAVAAVKAAAGSDAILIDVRGNGGGSTPVALLSAIMTAPYRGTLIATPLHIGELEARAAFDPKGHPFASGMVRHGGRTIPPAEGAWPGPIAILADRGCASACEDFLLRFKDGKRGLVLGETTYGSTGQPYYMRFEALEMALRVSTKREYTPDGAQFEGVGVTPDILIPRTAEDARSGGGVVLERAVAALLQSVN